MTLFLLALGAIAIGCILGYVKYIAVFRPLLKNLEQFLESKKMKH